MPPTYYLPYKNEEGVIIGYLFIYLVNPSRLDPGRREKNNLNFYFSHLFMVPQKVFKAFMKPFEAPQRNVKIKI